MSEDQVRGLDAVLKEILAQLRELNAREAERDAKASVAQHRYENL